MLSAIFAIFTRQIALGFFILTYCQIQLSELLIWHGIDTNNDEINKAGTSYGKYLLAMHNIGLSIGIILSIIYISKKELTLLNFTPLIVSILFFIFVLVIYYLPNNYSDITLPNDQSCKQESCQNPNNRLKWNYPLEWYLFGCVIFVIIVILYIKPVKSRIFILLFFFSTFSLSFFMKKESYSTIWCFLSAIVAPLLVIVNYFIIKNLDSGELLT